jgi:hypothetical protein
MNATIDHSKEMDWEASLMESNCAFSQDCFIGHDEAGGGGFRWKA